MKQARFPNMHHLRPPKPTIRTESVALAVARRLVKEINIDEFYWGAEEVPDRILDIQGELMRAGYPATVTRRLWRRQPPISDSGERPADPWDWEGIEETCRAIAPGIAKEEVDRAVAVWEERYA